jgi:hypothetical protein
VFAAVAMENNWPLIERARNRRVAISWQPIMDGLLSMRVAVYRRLANERGRLPADRNVKPHIVIPHAEGNVLVIERVFLTRARI